MTILNTQGSWNVGRSSAQCAACGTTLAPNAVCWAALCDRPVVELSPAEKATAAAAAEKESRKKGKEPEPAAVSPFIRVDYCEKCWAEGKRPTQGTMFSFWKTTVPEPQQKKKLLVDDAVLVDVFQRMESRNEPQEIRFRFVLALILMRKRLLKYEGMEENTKHETQKAKPAAAGDAGADATQPPTHPLPAPELWRML